MNKFFFLYSIALVFFLLQPFSDLKAQSIDKDAMADAVSGLKFRSVGPAVMGGRIADIAIHPEEESTWYVAVGSGGLWKTVNSGVSWTPIFDAQNSYSIGTVAIDPNNPSVIWVGTGENVSGRHVGWGDGVYKSKDGGQSWKSMGLERSEHIGKILIDPRNSDVVFVAAEGPLWSSGGDRGLYKTINGGENWTLALEIDENTGVTDIEFDPSNPDIIYAAAYQRRRQVWSLLSGGPQSGIYKSTDNGEQWSKMVKGLPKGDKGKIGLAVTPADPARVYATIEANNGEKGFYKSMDKAESWEKQNAYISGGTGPHYYQEIEASPTNPDLVYQMDVFLHVTRDGGKTFDYLETARDKHSDNHALWIDPENGKHLLVGTDGGLYESFDEGLTWRHFSNLPISQFYKLGLDNAIPFYNIVGGAQDLGTLLGPSRTMNTEGVRNSDWYVPLGADGYDCAFDPEDPNIVYMEIQEGILYRHDRRTEEGLNIQPQPEVNDPPERWNWDSPLLISPHNPKTLYFGSQRLWKSEDRGNSWKTVSGDLTTNTNRYELEIIDRVWSVDDLYDNGAMSKYATLTAVAESPEIRGIIYTGSDDGLIYITEDDGQNWRKSGALPRLPERSFINDIEASHHIENMVFATADNHKKGDFSPYIFLSRDRGTSWKSIAGDLPQGTIVWVIKQDHVDPNLLFIGTEYGIYFSPNMGENWIKLNAGVPTISFRDLELHPRDNDLVGATFGRGFYILDDYSPLRNLSEVVNSATNTIFPVRDAWWYVPNEPFQAKGMPSQGTASFATANPPFGASFTYYINDIPKTTKKERQEAESTLKAEKESIPFPGYEQLEKENKETEPQILFLVRDQSGNEVKWIEGSTKKGIHRAHWDLRYPSPDPINLVKPTFIPPWVGDPKGPLAIPGIYTVELYLLHNGELTLQGNAREFRVISVPGQEENLDHKSILEFSLKTSELSRQISSAGRTLGEAGDRLRHIKAALLQTPKSSEQFFKEQEQLHQQLIDLRTQLNGDQSRQSLNEARAPGISSRIGYVIYGLWDTRQEATVTQKRNVEIAETEFLSFRTDLQGFLKSLEEYEEKLEKAGAPWTRGRTF